MSSKTTAEHDTIASLREATEREQVPLPELQPLKPDEQAYERFIFERYYYDEATGRIELFYSLDDVVKFKEVVHLPEEGRRKLPKSVIDRLVFNLHLIGGISYYKAYCPSTIEIRSGVISKKEAHFWNKLYTKGLGEFFFENQIDFRGLVNFPYHDESAAKILAGVEEDMERVSLGERCLVPLGGGKDSIVTAELLKADGHEFDLFNLGGHGVAMDVAKVMGKTPLVVKRELSKKLFELNEAGAFNGHVPISAYIFFLCQIVGYLFDYKTICFGNEASANEGNAEVLGVEINHQYSKSFEFEEDFDVYVRTYLKSGVQCVSLLRAWNEIRIAQEFSHHPQYFSVFSSCNRNFKIQKDSGKAKREGHAYWCNECPKCAFVFAVLAPFLTKEALIKIFGENLFEREDLWPLYEDLLGIGVMKPFECVGTADEVAAALWLCAVKTDGVTAENIAFAHAHDFVLEQFIQEAARVPGYHESVFGWQEPHLIPESLLECTQKANVLILGYGKEGQVSLDFFKDVCPEWRIAVADRKKVEILNKDEETDGAEIETFTGSHYMDRLFAYHYVVKAPGVPWNDSLIMISERVQSGTQLFFSGLEPSSKVIGVTGSKGKSTTSTLIYEMAKKALEAGELRGAGEEGEGELFTDVKLVGNIGDAAMKYVDEKNTLFVYELSSYQLEGIDYSPDVAVFTSFFPDHLNYHGNLERYFDAKANITLHQSEKEVFIYPSGIEILGKIQTQAQRLPVQATRPFDTKLPGAHNQSNIALAIAAVSLFGASKDSIQAALDGFSGLPHRLETVGTFKGITFVDDANATTPEGTLAALAVYGAETGCLFLGGEDRGYDFSELARVVVEHQIPYVVLFPDTGARIQDEIFNELEREGVDGPEFFETRSMEDAVKWAYEKTPEGKTCLLSMASPSYTLFKNFTEKGELFQKFVREGAK
jgi:UDP-N-acetylmuramoylalanine--D-glutamate ligase